MAATPEAPKGTRYVRARRLGSLAFAAALAVAASALVAPSAEAGRYVVKECHFGDSSAPDAVYLTNGSLAFTPANSCATEQGVGVGTQGTGFAGGIFSSWTFNAPPGAFINTVSLGRRSYAAGGYAPIVYVCTVTGNCLGYSDNVGVGLAFQGTQYATGDWSYLTVFIGCSVGPCNAGGHVAVRDIVFNVDDVTSPVVSSFGGSLIAGGNVRGTESLVVGATDAGGGVRRLAVKVNGAEIASRQIPCDVYDDGAGARMRPCGPASESFSIDTEAPAWVEGNNTLEVCAYDYAVNAPNQGCATRTVTIDNSCPTSAGGSQATSLAAGVQKQGATSPVSPAVSVRSTEGATVRGELDGAGGPVAGANVCIYETIAADGEPRNLVQVTKTKADGTFAAQVEPGPSRDLDVVYRFNNKLLEGNDLYLDSTVRPTLRLRADGVLSNGQSVGFLGAIPGPRNEGRPIALQARVGKKWRTFKQIKTNDKGAFRGRYKFTTTRGLVIYRFRARVKRQGGYPYSPGNSHERKVRVRGE